MLDETNGNTEHAGIRLLEISQSIPGLIYQLRKEMDGALHFTFASDSCVGFLGIELPDLYADATAFFSIIHAEDVNGLMQSINASAETLQDLNIEFRLERRGANLTKWVKANASTKKMENGTVIWNGMLVDITDIRAEAHNSLLIKSAFDNAIEGIIITDVNLPDAGIIFANQSFYDLTEYAPDEVLGKNCRFLQGPETDPEMINTMRNHIKRKEKFQGELLNYKKSGEAFWNSLTMVPILNNKGELTHFIGSQNDVTKRKIAEANVLAANEELDSFNYTVSHDLKAPIRNIQAFSNLLKKKYGSSLEEEAQEFLEFIESSANRMDAIITDLLALAKFGKEQLNPVSIDLNELVGSVWDKISFTTPHSAKLVVPELPMVKGDASMLEQVLINLLSNAVKYSSKKKQPEVIVGYEATADSITFFIRDNGAGFDMKNYDRLFGVFQRLHGSSDFDGTGVGLNIVKRIIEKHQGRVWANGEVGEGATFYFTLGPAQKRGSV